jgi:hypothetical protein
MNQATNKFVLEENLLPSALFFPAGQYSMPHSLLNQGVDGGPPDQDTVMARFDQFSANKCSK